MDLQNHGDILQAHVRCGSQQRNPTFCAKDCKTGQTWWIYRIMVISHKHMSDVGHNNKIPPSVPRILRLDRLDGFTELRWPPGAGMFMHDLLWLQVLQSCMNCSHYRLTLMHWITGPPILYIPGLSGWQISDSKDLPYWFSIMFTAVCNEDGSLHGN